MLFYRVIVLTHWPQILRSNSWKERIMKQKSSSKSPRILQVRRDRDDDCVYVQGKKIMLGRTGTPEAEAAYRQLQIQVLTDPTLSSLKPQQVTVDSLCLAYLQYAKENDPDHFVFLWFGRFNDVGGGRFGGVSRVLFQRSDFGFEFGDFGA